MIHGEKIKYDERRHWAILVEPFLETLSVLVIITVVAGGAGNSLAVALLLAAVGFLFYRLRNRKFNRIVTYAVVGIFLYLFLSSGAVSLALLAILFSFILFAYKALIWLFFERLYITNRRVILAHGFLGQDISTMPLTRVTDINYRTTIPGEILGYASLRVETAGQDQALSWLQYLEKPATFYATLIDLSTAAVGSVTEEDETIATNLETIVDPDAHLGTLDEDDGGGTLSP